MKLQLPEEAANRLTAELKAQGWTQSAVAEQLKVSQVQTSKILRGQAAVPVDLLVKLICLVEMDIALLFPEIDDLIINFGKRIQEPQCCLVTELDHLMSQITQHYDARSV